ncbi:MAG: WG repeat-containing protein [Bryobacterales bacterium]|nr:WG repeat-containing protein [Bryobacterales bacterium]
MRRRKFIAALLASPALAAPYRPEHGIVMKFLDSDTPLFPYRGGINRTWGFINAAGQVVIPAETSRIEARLADFNEGMAAVQLDDGRGMMIDAKGAPRFAIPVDNHGWNYVMRDGLVPYREPESGKWGYYDAAGKVAIPVQYDMAWPFREQRGIVRVGEQYGIIATSGRWIVRPNLTQASEYRQGLAPVGRYGNWTYVHPDGRPAFGTDFESARAFGGGFGPVKIKSKWGAIDATGKLVVPALYDDAWAPHSAGTPLLVKKGRAWGFVDALGREVVPPKYYFCYSFCSGYAAVQDPNFPLGHYYFINAIGARLPVGTFDEAYPFVLDRAWVKLERENRWITPQGKVVFSWRS